MKGHHLRREVFVILTAGALLLGSAAAVGAQPARQTAPTPVASSFDELRSRLQSGATLVVTDSVGREVRGRLSELSATSLRLLVHGKPREFSPADISLIKQRQRDSWWNGFLIGLTAGAAPAIYWRFADPNECGGSICMSDLATGMIPAAAIGLAIDAAISKRVVVYHGSRTP